MNPPPTSLPTTSLWVIPMYQPQACCTLRQTWTDSLSKSLVPLIPLQSSELITSREIIGLASHVRADTAPMRDWLTRQPGGSFFRRHCSCLPLIIPYSPQLLCACPRQTNEVCEVHPINRKFIAGNLSQPSLCQV